MLSSSKPVECRLKSHYYYYYYYYYLTASKSWKRNGVTSRADQRVLRWFGHVERMDEYCVARRVLMAEESGGRVRGRPRLGWMDGVKVALSNKGMTMEAARQCAKDRKECLVHM